ncbi:SUR7/PalI family [Rhizoctonia solani]|uniref:SUR7/PalI family n=1 Tax=Rhizoctonia solani TaxID=456999 RepID=A0A8H7M5U6_9AGAM|nr:SUR7/PalI family [Rhizoctonia solani]
MATTAPPDMYGADARHCVRPKREAVLLTLCYLLRGKRNAYCLLATTIYQPLSSRLSGSLLSYPLPFSQTSAPVGVRNHAIVLTSDTGLLVHPRSYGITSRRVLLSPWFKSVYFLRAAISQSGVSGSVTFGVLGYCLDFNNQVQCSKPSVGWEFGASIFHIHTALILLINPSLIIDPNSLLGNDLPIQIPNVVVKWITYALVLHIVALGLAGVSAVFGLLAHVRNMTMSCMSSCISGTAAAVALIAFIFDLVLFFAVRARVNNVQGGSASIGNALWMTLAAWALLFFSGCAYAFGRCCVSKGPSGTGGGSGWRRSRKDSERTKRGDDEDDGKFDRESERMRMDAIRAENDRKARQRAEQQEVGLPAFYEYERTPLRREEPQYYEEEVEVIVPYTDGPGRGPSRGSQRSQRTQPSGSAASAAYRPNRNYEPGAPGTRAIDDYYNNTAPTAASLAAANTYPPQPQPQPQRQPSQPTQRQDSQNVPPVPSVPQVYSSPPTRSADPYAAMPQPQPQSRVDPYLTIAGAVGGATAATGHAANRSRSTDSYNHQQYPSSSHQQYPSPSHQQYRPLRSTAVMVPPQPTHYQDNSNPGYQGYDGAQHQQGYDYYAQDQQRDPYAQRQGYDTYGQQQQEYDLYGQQQQGYDPYGQQQQGYESYGQQQGYESYANNGYSHQQQPHSPAGPVIQPQPIPSSMPQPHVQEPEPRNVVASPDRGLVASPSPIGSPSYTPQPPQNISTGIASAVAGPSSGQGQAHGHQHQWSVGARSEESTGEAPPQYEATPTTSAYPVEKR